MLVSSALPGWKPERVAAAARATGIAAVEWGVGPGQRVDSPRAAAALIGKLGSTCAGVCVHGGAATPSRLAPYLALAAELGAPHVRVFAPVHRQRAAAQARTGLERAAELADRYAVAVLVETSPATIAPVAWRRIRGTWSWRHAPLGSGLVDWPAVLGALEHAGYDRSLSLDHLGGPPSLATLRREVSHLRELLEA